MDGMFFCNSSSFLSLLFSAVMQSLPDFGDRLRARDCELMLQYLTVPYLRIPLVIKFFADPVRMQVWYCLHGVLYAAPPSPRTCTRTAMHVPGVFCLQAVHPAPGRRPFDAVRQKLSCSKINSNNPQDRVLEQDAPSFRSTWELSASGSKRVET